MNRRRSQKFITLRGLRVNVEWHREAQKFLDHWIMILSGNSFSFLTYSSRDCNLFMFFSTNRKITNSLDCLLGLIISLFEFRAIKKNSVNLLSSWIWRRQSTLLTVVGFAHPFFINICRIVWRHLIQWMRDAKH